MNETSPLDAIETWLKESAGNSVVQIAAAIGTDAKDADVAAEGLMRWLRQPRDSFAGRGAATMLRALIDFECLVMTSDPHQDLLDQNLLNAVDYAGIPTKNRAAINEFLGVRSQDRPAARDAARKAAEAWTVLRPTDQSIYEWWWSRIADLPTNK